ncbi:hypothetical protein PCASD_24323 [Puccinia coronata f. sp. avenae]|uniref:Uncharacterized protein n=1 Tax=Puccinia coronata f. sp. avenae TaxID=200324 RepID=A0A2N5SDP6_9BASI|nr:hypothetical protein PCASD_24323 [Puccinia coronata f. sp. avenae]
MPSNSNSTPSPKQRNRFISTLRRTLRPHTQPASPNTPPPFGKTKNSFSISLGSRDSHSSSPTSSGSSDLSTPSPSTTRSPQPTPQQRRYAAIFSKVTFSTAEFIEDRYVYSQSPSKPDGPMTAVGLDTGELESQEELGPPSSFFAIPSTRQPSIDQSQIRLSQMLTSPTRYPHHADQSSDFPSSSSPLRSCFQEVFDLLDAGIIDQQIEYLGPDTSYQLSSNFLEPSTPDATLDIPHIGRLDEPLELPLPRITATQTCLPTPCASLSESLFDPTRGGTEHESIDLLPASISDSLENLPEIGMSDELSDISGAAKSNKSVQEANGSEVLENPIEDADTIQTFLHTLSAALRSDPTEFSPRVSEWNRESIDFSWLQSEDQINLHPLLPSHQVTLQTLPSSNLQQETHLPKFLKRSTARAKKNNLLKFQTSNTSRIFSL